MNIITAEEARNATIFKINQSRVTPAEYAVIHIDRQIRKCNAVDTDAYYRVYEIDIPFEKGIKTDDEAEYVKTKYTKAGFDVSYTKGDNHFSFEIQWIENSEYNAHVREYEQKRKKAISKLK